ncbi:MAG: DNA polymerase III subunit alpha [bacterium JZ-2024 1]
MGFVHLHLHTEYSLLDGIIRIPDLIREAERRGMKALALTDHGALYGAVEFVRLARKAGIRPIIGCEIYFTPSRARNSAPIYHFTLLAQTEKGYRNLVQMVTDAHLRGFFRKPRVDWDSLSRWSADIICLTGCEHSIINQKIVQEDEAGAEKDLAQLREIFGSRLFVEVQNHHRDVEKKLITVLRRLARKYSVPLVATNDVHYLRKSDAPLQDVVLCIQTNATLDEPDRVKFENEEYELKTEAEMNALFSEIPEALANTEKVAEMCEDYMHLPVATPQFPSFSLPEGFVSEEAFFERLCRQGLEKKVPGATQEYYDRLEYEMKIIRELGFIPYFLVVWDIIREARSRGIPVGPGRGSSAGSLVSYCLDITRVDPVKYRLMFERFLNPSRKELPDIDVDFCGERREEVIQYVRQKYGKENVAQIITFGKMLSRAAVRDVARVMRLPLSLADQVAKAIPFGWDIAEALRNSPELAHLYQSSPQVRKLLETAQQCEGIIRNASVHAGGVVIGARPLSEHIPLRLGKNNEVITQYAMDDLKDLGLVKMDFLGLRNLTIRDKVAESLREKRNITFDPDSLPLDDRKTFRLLQKGDTTGIFQFESEQARRLCREVAPENIEELTAINAMNRPGPLLSGMAEQFIRRKKGKEPIVYLHPLLRPILEDTFGVCLYQEQVMQIAMALAKFTPAEAEELRKAMGSKEIERMESLSASFLTRAEENGIPSPIARQIFTTLLEFARYAFNKSHSVSYAILAYQLAYLKAHYPLEFFTALLNSVIGNEEKTAMYLHELKLKRIPYYPPDIQFSGPYCEVEGEGIRLGLMCIKKVGYQHSLHIQQVREKGGKFRSLEDFLKRVDLHLINKGIVENLIKAGAMDSFHPGRMKLLAEYEQALNFAHSLKGREGIQPLFSQEPGKKDKGELPPSEPGWQFSLLEEEKKVLGFYLSGHPFAEFSAIAEELGIPSIHLVRKMEDRSTVVVAGFISQWEVRTNKKGGRFAKGILEDLSGMLPFQIPSRLLDESPVDWLNEKFVVLEGQLVREFQEESEEEKAVLLVGRVRSLIKMRKNKEANSGLRLMIHIPENALHPQILGKLKNIMEQYPGDLPVNLRVQCGNLVKNIHLPEIFSVGKEEFLLQKIRHLGLYAQFEEFT